jgi:serine/threonine-protein kinase
MPSRRGLLASCGAAAAALAGCTALGRGPDAPVVWEHRLEQRPLAAPGVADDVAVVPLEGRTVAVVDGEEAWSSPAEAATTPGSVDGGDLAVVAGRRRVPYRAVDTLFGEEAWTADADVSGLVSPAAGDGVLVGGDRSRVVGIDAATGEVVWSRAFEVPGADGGTVRSGAASAARVVDGTAYLRGGPGYLALEVATGEPVWRVDREPGTSFEVGQRNMSLAPAVGDGATYFWTTDGAREGLGEARVLARERADGSRRWSHRTEGAAAAPAYAAEPGLVIAGEESGRVAALHPRDGAVEWSLELDGRVAYAAPVAHRGVVYVPVSGDPARLVALDAATGERRFALTTGLALAPAAAGERVFAVGDDRLYALQAA